MTTQVSERQIREAVEDAREDSESKAAMRALLSWDKVEIIRVKVEGSDKT